MAPPGKKKRARGKRKSDEAEAGNSSSGDNSDDDQVGRAPKRANSAPQQRKASSSTKKAKAKKPDSGYTLFFRAQHSELTKSGEPIENIHEREVGPNPTPLNRNKALVKVISKRWNSLDIMSRLKYDTMAREEKEKRAAEEDEGQDESDGKSSTSSSSEDKESNQKQKSRFVATKKDKRKDKNEEEKTVNAEERAPRQSPLANAGESNAISAHCVECMQPKFPNFNFFFVHASHHQQR
mmetsp:Transcript_12255/g.25375  ORF Transcript_12255/g.25375 Transcript_12255/m.25375 type:complete len:238 (-) Transcript_12255:1817-2530(-)